ncbi:MAG: hypothetical protein ACLR8Y_07945 [Alistipes indistinctus]
MREGNSSSAIANLKSAISKNSAYKAKAAKDVEFAKLLVPPNSPRPLIFAKDCARRRRRDE